MKYRLIASDMDGTLLTTDKRISQRNAAAIRAFTDMGGIFCLCTGRTLVGVAPYVKELGLDSPIISANGAVVAMPDGEILYEFGMSDESARTLYAYARELDLTVCLWSQNLLYANRTDRYVEHYKKVMGIDASIFDDIEPIVSQGILKMIWFADPERMPELHAFLNEKCPADNNWANSTPRMIEFNDVRTSKATAMAYIGEKYGISKDEMIAMGDNFNDLPMLQYAGLSVAMGNAPDEIKEKCSYVTDTNDEDGVGKAIERFATAPISTLINEKIAAGETEIHLPEGRFYEKLHVEADHIKLIGHNTILTYDDYAKKPYNEEELYGTFRSYSAFFRTDLLYMEGVTIENTAGVGEDVGQAVAAYFDCSRGFFLNCTFKGFQDTIFTAPLPEKPVIPNSFKGPNENTERRPSLLSFNKCHIEGDVDFIFGGACALFRDCVIHSKRKGYVCAPSTPKEQKYGYIFFECRFTGDGDGDSYIARPWRKDGACLVYRSEIGKHISKELWHDWDNEEKRQCCRFISDIPGGADFGSLMTKAEEKEMFDFFDVFDQFL